MLQYIPALLVFKGIHADPKPCAFIIKDRIDTGYGTGLSTGHQASHQFGKFGGIVHFAALPDHRQIEQELDVVV